MNYFGLNTRQKSIMTEKDKKRQKDEKELCLQRISFYYNGVTFYHKYNLFSESIQPKVKIWCKRSEGLKLIGKGKKTGNNDH